MLALVALPALAQVEVEQPWARATAPGAKVAAGYMVIRNKSASPDRLLSATTDAAGRVETHVHIRDGEILRMREVKAYDLPANGRFELKPGGAHLMFVDLKAPFKEGDRVPVVLKFQNAGDVKVEFQVTGLAGRRQNHPH
jgi:hypothetical protein